MSAKKGGMLSREHSHDAAPNGVAGHAPGPFSLDQLDILKTIGTGTGYSIEIVILREGVKKKTMGHAPFQ